MKLEGLPEEFAELAQHFLMLSHSVNIPKGDRILRTQVQQPLTIDTSQRLLPGFVSAGDLPSSSVKPLDVNPIHTQTQSATQPTQSTLHFAEIDELVRSINTPTQGVIQNPPTTNLFDHEIEEYISSTPSRYTDNLFPDLQQEDFSFTGIESVIGSDTTVDTALENKWSAQSLSQSLKRLVRKWTIKRILFWVEVVVVVGLGATCAVYYLSRIEVGNLTNSINTIYKPSGNPGPTPAQPSPRSTPTPSQPPSPTVAPTTTPSTTPLPVPTPPPPPQYPLPAVNVSP